MLHGYFDRYPNDDFRFTGDGVITAEKEQATLRAIADR